MYEIEQQFFILKNHRANNCFKESNTTLAFVCHLCSLFHLFIWLLLDFVSLCVCGGGGGRGGGVGGARVKAGQLLSREARGTGILSTNLVPRRCDPFGQYQV